MNMSEFYMDVENVVCDAIEAGAKTNEEVFAYVRKMYGRQYRNLIDLETIQNITEKYVPEWM